MILPDFKEIFYGLEKLSPEMVQHQQVVMANQFASIEEHCIRVNDQTSLYMMGRIMVRLSFLKWHRRVDTQAEWEGLKSNYAIKTSTLDAFI